MEKTVKNRTFDSLGTTFCIFLQNLETTEMNKRSTLLMKLKNMFFQPVAMGTGPYP